LVSSGIRSDEDLAWGLEVTWNDEGPIQDAIDWEVETVSADAFAAESVVPEEARGLDSLLAGDEPPPESVWQKVQAKLRQEGIILS
jgi:hypothetical protein